MTIFVTGASGFLGRATVSLLLRDGQNVVAATRSCALFPVQVSSRRVLDYGQLRAESDDDTLIHLAEKRDLSAVEAAGSEIMTQAATLQKLLEQPWRKVIYASSAIVYGDAVASPRRPDETVSPESIYGKSKKACEDLVLSQYGSVARFANLVGSGMASGNVLSDIMKQQSGPGPIVLRNCSPVRDFLAVEDAAAGLLAILKSGERGIFNFGSGCGISVDELVHLVLAAWGQHGRPIKETAPSAVRSHLVLDIGSSEQRLGWRPQIGLREVIASLLRKSP